MCVVSMVTDHYQRQWPNPTHISPETYRDISELIRKAKEYDRIHSQPECPDAIKQKWLDEFAKATMPPINLTNLGPVKRYQESSLDKVGN